MFKIARGCGVLEKGIPYLIVSVTFWQNTVIELEQFGFVVGSDGATVTILPGLRTDIKTRIGPFPKTTEFEADKLLDEELILAKEHYSSWLYKQIGDKAFDQIHEMGWKEANEILPFALMYFSLNNEERERLRKLLENSICEELEGFLEIVIDLRLIVEKKSIQ